MKQTSGVKKTSSDTLITQQIYSFGQISIDLDRFPAIKPKFSTQPTSNKLNTSNQLNVYLGSYSILFIIAPNIHIVFTLYCLRCFKVLL